MILEKKLVNMKCVFWFPLQILSEEFTFLRGTERIMITNVGWSSCKYRVLVSDFN